MIHLIKLSVGSENVETLQDWQTLRGQDWADGYPRHVTRMWPRREKELLDGGSIYWVIKGEVLCRQRVLRLDEVNGEDGIKRCAIVLHPELVATVTAPRRAFQGWRYLTPEDAPVDLQDGRRSEEESLPASLAGALADIGVR